MSGHSTRKVTRELRDEQEGVLAPEQSRITDGHVWPGTLPLPPIIPLIKAMPRAACSLHGTEHSGLALYVP